MAEVSQYRILIISDDNMLVSDLQKILHMLELSKEKKTRNKNKSSLKIEIVPDIKTGIQLLEKKGSPSFILVFINLHFSVDKKTLISIDQIREINPETQIALCTPPGPPSEKLNKWFKQTPQIMVLKKPLVREEVYERIEQKIYKIKYFAIEKNIKENIISKKQQPLPLKELSVQIIEASKQGVMIFTSTPSSHLIVYVNPAFERMTGYSTKEIVGFSDKKNHPSEINKIFSVLEKQKSGRIQLQNYLKKDDQYWCEFHVASLNEGTHNYYAVFFSDITTSKITTDNLAYKATHDALTDLANRALLIERLRQAIFFSSRQNTKIAVLFFDVDDFKNINDNYGHRAGDVLLQTIGGRLSECVRESDTVARLGGDEFVVILTSLRHKRSYSQTLDRILDLLSEPFYLEGEKITFTMSVGISLYTNTGEDAKTLLKNADIALYQAKKQGRNKVQVFDDDKK